MAYLFVITHILCILIGFFCGARLGRNGSASGASRQSDSESVTVYNELERTVDRVEGAVEDIKSDNAKAAEIIEKMREVVNRNRGSGNS